MPFRHSWRGKPAAGEAFAPYVPAWMPGTPYVPEFAEQTRVKNRTQDVRFLNLPLDAFFEVLPHTGIKTFAREQLGMRSRFGNPALIDDTDC